MSEKTPENIHPISARMLSQEEKEKLLGQRGMVFWLTGLSGSGKSTIAIGVERKLHKAGHLVKIIDGDNIRFRINADLGFSMEDRRENIRRVAEVARLFHETGVITLCTFIAPTKAIRNMAREKIGDKHYREIYIECPLETCESRDPKGLYKKARSGEIKNFTGIDSEYEIPENPDKVVSTANRTVNDCVDELVEYILTESKL